MFKNILNTFFTKIFTALLSLIIVVINSKQLGADGVGTISLIILSISVFLLIHEFFSGAFVFFVPKSNNFQLMIIAYAGIVISLIPFAALYLLIPLAPPEYFYLVSGLSFMLSLSNVNQLILLGNEDIKDRNVILFIQTLTLFFALIYFFYVVKKVNVYSYIYSLYIGYGLSLISGWIKIKKYIRFSNLQNIVFLFKNVFRLGTYNALSNLIQKANYRLSYYLIEYFLGISALGRFSVAVQVSESTWLAGQSVASVQYARISNLDNKEKAASLSLQLLKLIALVTIVLIIFWAVLPENFYLMIFGNDFTGINLIISVLAPGIIAVACNMIFSHYFSGTGQYSINTIASTVGLAFIVFFGFLLIPRYGLAGAGLAMSGSYIASFIYSLTKFLKQTKISFKELFITQKDIVDFIRFLKQEFLKIRE